MNDWWSCGGIFDLDNKRESLNEHEARMASAGFWVNQEQAQEVVQRVKILKGWVEPFDRLESRVAGGLEATVEADRPPSPVIGFRGVRGHGNA